MILWSGHSGGQKRPEPFPTAKITNPSGAARRDLRGSSSLAGFDQSVRHHTCVVRSTSLVRMVSVPLGALEFCKATVTSSDLVTGEAASNHRFTVAPAPSRRSFAPAG
jgi:hypothetical protein